VVNLVPNEHGTFGHQGDVCTIVNTKRFLLVTSLFCFVTLALCCRQSVIKWPVWQTVYNWCLKFCFVGHPCHYGMPQRPWWTLQVTVAKCGLENQPYTKYCPSVARVTNKTELQTQIVNWESHWPIIDGNATWTAKVTKQNNTPRKAKKQSHSLPKNQQNTQVIQVGTDCASLSSQAGHEVKVQSSSFPKKTTKQASDSSGHRLCISILSSRSSSQSSIKRFPPKDNRTSKQFKWAQIVHLYPLKQVKKSKLPAKLEMIKNWKLKNIERLKLRNVFDHKFVSFDSNALIFDLA